MLKVKRYVNGERVNKDELKNYTLEGIVVSEVIQAVNQRLSEL